MNNPEKEEEEEQSRETGNIGQTRQKQIQKSKKMNNIKMLDITTRNDTFVYVDSNMFIICKPIRL
jgi:hypothetical protein